MHNTFKSVAFKDLSYSPKSIPVHGEGAVAPNDAWSPDQPIAMFELKAYEIEVARELRKMATWEKATSTERNDVLKAV